MELPRQIIFCVETETENHSDCIYIRALLDFYYKSTITHNFIKISFIPMNSKYKYCSKKVVKNIKDKKKLCSGNSFVVYVFDRDRSASCPKDNSFIKSVEKYCLENKFSLVWFVNDIENVMLGKKSSNKTNDAAAFKNSMQIKNVRTRILNNPNPQHKIGSNILCVLNKLLGEPEEKVE